MLTQGEDVEAHALAGRGWTISAIARHLGRDRKTVRAYLAGERQPGVRRRPAPDPIEPFVAYVGARFGDDPHLWLTALFDEVTALGYPRSYPSFVRGVRRHAPRPRCERCRGVKARATIEISHPPGDEIQWDWFERRKAPWGGTAYVLLGTLPHSGRVRGVISSSMDQPHLVDAIDGVLRRLGGTARAWRTDRMSTVIVPGSGDVQASFAPVAKHYGVSIRPCPYWQGIECGLAADGERRGPPVAHVDRTAQVAERRLHAVRSRRLRHDRPILPGTATQVVAPDDEHRGDTSPVEAGPAAIANRGVSRGVAASRSPPCESRRRGRWRARCPRGA